MKYKCNSYLTEEDLSNMSLFLEKSTSKKDRKIRSVELFKIVMKPLSKFFEEKLSFNLLDTKPNRVMNNLFVALAEQGEASDSDLVDEMLRQVQKPYEADAAGNKQLLFGHPLVHRMLKGMIKGDVAREAALGDKKDKEEDGKSKKLKFSSTLAKIVLKHFDDALKGRGVFILLELFECEATQPFVSKQLKS